MHKERDRKKKDSKISFEILQIKECREASSNKKSFCFRIVHILL